MSKTAQEDATRKPWDPVGDFAAAINKPIPTEAEVGLVLDQLRLDMLEVITWQDRTKLLALQTALFAVYTEARKLRSTKHRAYGLAAAKTMLEIMSDLVSRMRPPEQDNWVRNSTTARKVILLLSVDHLRGTPALARKTRRSEKWITKLTVRLERSGLVKTVFGPQSTRYFKLMPAGEELQTEFWLKDKRERHHRSFTS